MSRLTGVRFPIDWERFGFPSPWQAGGTVVADGKVAWSWDGDAPGFGIGEFRPGAAAAVEGWVVDHVVLLVPDIEDAVGTLRAAGSDLRMRMEVRGRPTAFYLVGTLLEVIQTRVPVPGLYGIALATEDRLDDVRARWEADGHDVSEVRPAIQPGRHIFTVRGLESGLVVMDGREPASDGRPTPDRT